jgi:sarcosine oxidase, subunit beta
MLVGGTEPECDPLEWIDDPDRVDPRPTLDQFEAQVLRTARRFPELPVPRRPSGVVGVYDVSSDWIPIYDRTGLDGYYVAIGTSGNQFKNTPVVGELMATLVLAVEAGQDHDRDPVTFRCSFTGADVDLAAFSRRRPPNLDSSGTVMD